MSGLSRQDAETLLFTEALHLDRRAWDEWLALYTEDCLFWMPAWRDETTPTQDPDRELSLIYYQGRRSLEERVWRVRSGQSVASTPLPRSVHVVTNVLVERDEGDAADVTASFVVHRFDARSEATHAFFGRYAFRLARRESGWRIAGKTIILMNDSIPTVLDFFGV